MKACWVWGLQGVERHLRGPSTSRQEPSGAPCSLEEDLAPSAQDQGSPERPVIQKGLLEENFQSQDTSLLEPTVTRLLLERREQLLLALPQLAREESSR